MVGHVTGVQLYMYNDFVQGLHAVCSDMILVKRYLYFLQIATVVGGMSRQKQERILKKHPEIVVATPGRLWELIQEVNNQYR
jgi:superfamily II DNA/RNA helicase